MYVCFIYRPSVHIIVITEWYSGDLPMILSMFPSFKAIFSELLTLMSMCYHLAKPYVTSSHWVFNTTVDDLQSGEAIYDSFLVSFNPTIDVLSSG